MVFIVIQFFLFLLVRKRASHSGWWFPVLQTLPFVFYFLSMAYSENTAYGWRLIETTMLLYILPWVFYFTRGRISTELAQSVLRYYGFLMSAFSVFILVGLTFGGTFSEASNSADAYYVIRTRLEEISGLHPTYFSLMVGLGLLIIQHRLKNEQLSKPKRIWGVFALLAISFALLLASSKMIIAALFVTSLIIWAQGRSFKSIFRLAGLAVVGLAIAIAIIRPLRERVSSLFLALNQEQVEELNPDSMRKAIYKCGSEAIAEHWLMGVGLGDQQDVLNEKYEKYGFKLARFRQFNTHNQYLQFWLATGVFPFLLFILLQLTQLAIAIASRHYLHIAVVLLFSLSLLTENLLSRQDGVFIYILFSSFMVYYSWAMRKDRRWINGRFLAQDTTGVQRFAKEISAQILKQDSHFKIIAPKGAEQAEQVKTLGGFAGTIWEQFTLPLFLKLTGSPRLLNLGNAAPLLYKNQFITIHDIAFKANPTWFSRSFVRWYNFMIPKIARRSKHIFTVSAFSKAEIQNAYGVKPEKISVVYNGVPNLPKAKKASRFGDGEYVLSVGSITPRKNQELLVKCFAEDEQLQRFKLVLAGSMDDAIYGDSGDLFKQINNSENIIFIENPSDQELADLYHGACFTAYVAKYEGFGLPILESMAYGKAVLASNIPVFRELFADAVVYVKLDNYEHIRGQIIELFSNLELRAQMEKNGKIIAQEYSYLRSSELMLQVLEKV